MAPKQTELRLSLSLLLVSWCATQLIPVENAMAQRRVPSRPVLESPSQRYLPLPQTGSTNPRQQLELLKQLQGLLTADPAGTGPMSLPKLSPDDMKVLQEAMQNWSGSPADDTGRSGGIPSPLPGISPEQVSKALSDPAMREQVKQALEQFAKNGNLPSGRSSTSPNGLPFPPNSPLPNRASRGDSLDQPSPNSPSKGDPLPMQQIAQSLLERLAKQPENPSINGTEEMNRSENPAAGPVDPNLPPTGPFNRNSQTASDGSTPRPPDNFRRGIPPVMKNFLENSRNPGNPVASGSKPTHPPGGPGGDSAMAGRTEASEPRQPNDTTEAARPKSPEPSKPDDPRSAVAPPMHRANPSADAKASPMDVRTELQQRGFAQTLRQLVDQARQDAEHEIQSQTGTGAAGGEQPTAAATSGELQGQMMQALSSVLNNQSPTASNSDSNNQQASASPGGSSGTPGSGTANEGSWMERSARAAGLPGSSAPSAQQASPAKSTTLSHVSETANKVFSSIITPPEPAPMKSLPLGQTMATAAAGAHSGAAGARSVMWLGMLLVLLAVAMYAIPRLATSIGMASRTEPLAVVPIHPTEIRTRRDVVRAFHQFALRPLTPVADWWTHRQVAQQVASSTPALEPAIQQLAEIYEQARYLPEETEFTPDQIGTARRALEQCRTNSPQA
ncbi:MAG: DUF4129 domain-containing protein [Planctomycetes bacterium]|nr:DUF4129 domain-containing protein [Planctomycetota bacterium]